MIFFRYETLKIQIKTDINIKYFFEVSIWNHSSISSFCLNLNFYRKKTKLIEYKISM